ncbi:n-acetylmuramoyl-l-alanine amidase, putative [Heliomicrobium modesticaldum Ice1]|uniref:N-acetylmuramoyl-l-alanine amidase, putative n=1 Tax=Heliobacterium modesticaldum (strain ATCC 51547 / Ice1) TaxID=498761 RepID=B0TBX6_HELMI|nr:n-acetylmuramoyl-l-alanine amidase, putative [Heliomicrobium modesticaldum Ice1]
MTALFFLGQPLPAHAASPSLERVNLVINGKSVISDPPPLIVKDRVLVPLRVVSEQMGLKVAWNSQKYEATLVGEGLTILLRPGQREANVNGKAVSLDAPAQLRKDRLFVPFRFVGASMGGKIDWDSASRTAYVTTASKTSSPSSPADPVGQAPGMPATPDPSNLLTPPSPLGTTTPSGAAKPSETVGSSGTVPSLSGQLTDIDWQIENNRDVIILAKTDRTQFQLSVLGEPDRLVVDLPGAKLAEGLPKNRVINLGPVKQVRLGQFREDTARVVIDLNGPAKPQIQSEPGGLRIRIPGTTVLRRTGIPLILLDPGHGGSDPGALGPTGKQEKDFTLPMALKVRDLLVKEGVDVLLTRSVDMDVSLADRGTINNRIRPDLFFSIHANAAARSEAGGTETWICAENGRSLAEAIQRKVQPATGREDRGVKQANFYVLRTSEVPAALLETAFISNAEEEKLLFSADFQDRVARAVVAALMEYLKKPMRS